MRRWLPLLIVIAWSAAARAADGGASPDADGGTPPSAALMAGDGGFAAVAATTGAQPEDGGTEAAQEDADPLASLPAADPLSFKAALEKAEVTLAEPFNLTIEVHHSAREKYSLPQDLHLKKFGLRSSTSEQHGTDPKTTLFRLTLQAFEVGNVELPAIHLAVQTADGDKQLEIPPQKLKVNGIIDTSQGKPQMREDTKPLPTRYHTVWWPLAAVLGGIAAIVGGWFLVKRMRQPPPPPPPTPRLPPYDEAIQRLAALETANLVMKGEKQAYYFRLSEIVRDYIGRRFSFEALELTSDELLHELRKRSTPGLDYDRLTGFLREADLVKFAKVEPTDGECKTAIDLSRFFVQQTRPVLAVAEAGRQA